MKIVANLKSRKRAGLTLIELLVVLFILAAVAGVSLSILPNFQKKTHGATSASSIRAAESSITANLITGGVLGNNFDGLITAAGAVPAYIANADGLVAVTPDADMVAALSEIGITSFYPALDVATLGGDNATLESHDYTAATTITTSTALAALEGTAKVAETADKFNIASPTQIFAFGLGQECSLVGLGQAFKEAPLHTPGEGSAATRYGRYAILVGYNAGAEPEAFYLGTTCIDDFENFNNITNNLGEFFEASN